MAGFSAAQTLDQMPEAFVSGTAISREVSRAVKAGKLRKIASRLYTRNLTDKPEAVIRRNLWNIVAGYFPGALIADRTALENAPAEDGSVCLVYCPLNNDTDVRMFDKVCHAQHRFDDQVAAG